MIKPWMLLWILSFFALVKGDMECIKSDLCDCYMSSELEYQCPKSTENYLVLRTIPGKYVSINCREIFEYDLNMLPNLDVGDLNNFISSSCRLPIGSFNATLEKFNISRINYMLLEYLGSTNSETVRKELFDGLHDLKSLEIRASIQTKFEKDFLEYLPNLITLSLEDTGIQEIEDNFFKNVPKLHDLRLESNSIAHLSKGLFENLSDLEKLHLSRNRLTSLNRKSFIGLKRLESLELSCNNISSLDEDTFAELVNLVRINLRSNRLQNVTPNIFKHNTALKKVWIGNNPHLNLSDYVFANLTNLMEVNIDKSNLKSLPEHSFEGCFNLTEISLKENIITELLPTVFGNLTKLEKLFLDGNKIKILPDNIFSPLVNLKGLSLSKNELEKINDVVFRKLSNLVTLNLSDNKIAKISLHAFMELKKLNKMDLSHNMYDLIYGKNAYGFNPFKYCDVLETLNLSHNKIASFPENVLNSHLGSLDLDYNQITMIKITSLIKVPSHTVKISINNNNVSDLDFKNVPISNEEEVKPRNATGASTVLYLSNNPIRCDCTNFDLIKYINDKMGPIVKTLIDIRPIEDLRCATPESFSKFQIKDLKPCLITCPLNREYCPRECQCAYRPCDRSAVVDCSYRNLTKAPVIDHRYLSTFPKLEVDLMGNFLDIPPYKGLGYDTVTTLYLSNNRISNISWIPPKIEILSLNGNQLQSLDPLILNSLNDSTTIQNLTLSNNPWSCDCSAATLQNYLRSHYKKVKDTDVICADNNKPLVNRKELCKSHFTIAVAIASIILLAVVTVLAVYFYYQEPIKVWLYAKNLCIWCITEEELDKDKMYDVFISYSHKDEDFVLQNLLPVLEQGPNPFKVCIHIRDWIPGKAIAEQVASSVLDSRRTLVVLSESFLESVWGKIEFRLAHIQAISEERARVIILKYGNVADDKLDNELKAYLKTNTYVEWGDPWFWNKLKYALPHSKQNKFYNNNQKHAKIMLKIDDKFELASSQVIHMENTPPAVPLDPSLLNDHPLTFKEDSTISPTNIPLIER